MASAWRQSVSPHSDLLVSLRKATKAAIHPALPVFPARSSHYIIRGRTTNGGDVQPSNCWESLLGAEGGPGHRWMSWPGDPTWSPTGSHLEGDFWVWAVRATCRAAGDHWVCPSWDPELKPQQSQMWRFRLTEVWPFSFLYPGPFLLFCPWFLACPWETHLMLFPSALLLT